MDGPSRNDLSYYYEGRASTPRRLLKRRSCARSRKRAATYLPTRRATNMRCPRHWRGKVTTSTNLADAQPRSFRLPDGSHVRLEGERFRASEALFDPSVLGSEEPGAAELVALACRRADLDLRATLYESVVLAGGSTLFPGFGERLVKDLRSKLPDTTIRVRAPPERALSCWIGGSILASLATFKSMWVLRSGSTTSTARPSFRGGRSRGHCHV